MKIPRKKNTEDIIKGHMYWYLTHGGNVVHRGTNFLEIHATETECLDIHVLRESAETSISNSTTIYFYFIVQFPTRKSLKFHLLWLHPGQT